MLQQRIICPIISLIIICGVNAMSQNFPRMEDEVRIIKLKPPQGKVRMVLDTDTYNEIDDQYALVYALLSGDKLELEAVYAAPFYNAKSTGPADGMEKSYLEILKILKMFKRTHEDFAFRGSVDYLRAADQPQESEAARDLVKRAMAAEEPLYVAAVGAITNVASAILMEPKIVEKIVVVWLGGHATYWPHTREFNLKQDILASRLVLDCGVPFVRIPTVPVTSHLHTTLPELEKYVKGRGALGDYLYEIFKEYRSGYAASKVIWDISAIAFLINPDWVPTVMEPSPIVTDQVTWSRDSSRHLIRNAVYINRDKIFGDLFKKLQMRTEK